MNKSRSIAVFGVLIGVALVLSYVESLLPPLVPIPGIKIGLANIAVIFVLYTKGLKHAAVISIVRVLLAGFLFGSATSMIYALSGAALSLLAMGTLRKLRFGICAVSVCGGVMHNVGQILAAMLLSQTNMLLMYLAILWFTGMASGAVIGLAGGSLVKRIGDCL